MRLGHIRFSTKRSKSPRMPPMSFLNPAGALRKRRGMRALVASHDLLWLLLHCHQQQQQQQDEEAEKGESAGDRLAREEEGMT